MRIVNEASPNKMTYMSGYVEPINNTVPLDLMIFEYADILGNEQIIEHIGNLLNIKLKIVKEKK